MLASTIKQIYAIPICICILLVISHSHAEESDTETPVDPSQTNEQVDAATNPFASQAAMALFINNDKSGEALWLGDSDKQYAALYRPSTKGHEIAALLINTNFSALTQHSALRHLYQNLPDLSISTLSLALPDKPAPFIPPRSTQSALPSNPDSNPDNTSGDTSDDTSENSEEAGQSSEPAPSETDDYQQDSQQRISDAISFLKEQNHTNIIIIFNDQILPIIAKSKQNNNLNLLDWVVIGTEHTALINDAFNNLTVDNINLLVISTPAYKKTNSQILRHYALAGFKDNIYLKSSSELNATNSTQQLSKIVKGWLKRLSQTPP